MRLFVDGLTNVDFSYLCPKRGLLGETWLANVELEGPLDHQGMVCDFGIVKKQLRDWLDTTLDHKLLVPTTNTAVSVIDHSHAHEVSLGAHIHTTAPTDAFAYIPVQAISPEPVARWCETELKGAFGPGVQHIQITFEPEDISGAFYHYSHGLKKHNGNCQRIAHGHRSKILIWRNGELSTQTMQQWATLWRDIYLATTEDCIEQRDNHCDFKYRAPQGEFQLRLPKAQCYFLDTDTTVEHIAQHIADVLAKQFPGEHIQVKAFEGISKGAIAEACIGAPEQ